MVIAGSGSANARAARARRMKDFMLMTAGFGTIGIDVKDVVSGVEDE